MKKDRVKKVSILLVIISVISISVNAYAHSGRTDANGGHRDNNNKSGLGSYHYHCGGHPPHLHNNGICPYSSETESTKSSTSSKSSSSFSDTKTTAKTVSATPVTVDVTEIKINERIESIEIGKSQKLTVTITPSDATDTNVTWKSDNENIATVNTTGEVVAKNQGIVYITATSANGKTSTIKINVREPIKEEKMDLINTSNTTNSTTNNKSESNPIGGIITLGALGSGGYWGYKKFKK